MAINQFRTISRLNVEGKIFSSVMASRLTKYLTYHESVQKGGIPRVYGCLEHATMIWDAIQRALRHFVGPGKYYGSVPHQMIPLALRMYHVPGDIQVMLDDYFSGFRMRFSVRRGKLGVTTTFAVTNHQTSTVSQEPVKSLGRW